MPAETDALVERALAGDRVATAKLLSLVEQGGDGARAVVSRLHPHTGRAWSVGITGAPGAGKSTLTDALVARVRADGLEVGVPWVIVETVGVGQVEVEIASQADTTIVVVNPGWGDEVQAAKAGLLEIADIFVVNKADRAGTDATVS